MDGNGNRETVAYMWSRGHRMMRNEETIHLIRCPGRDQRGQPLWRAARYRQGQPPEHTQPGTRAATQAAISRWIGNAFIGHEVRTPAPRPAREYTPVTFNAA